MSEEEIKFLREHIKGICAYKGLQEELTYDVSLDILRKICLALDFLQQENSQLKERIEKAINKIEEFNKKEKLSMYVDTWKHLLPILKILKGDKE